jgi:hypothetical protein
MNWSDPIVDEVRRVRDEYAARFNYDLRAIYRDLKEQEKRSGRRFVSYAQDGLPGPNHSLRPTGAAAPVPEPSKITEAAPAAEHGGG